MPELLPRFHRFTEQLEDERKIAKAILEAGEAPPTRAVAGATAGGDRRRARGVPLVGRGIGGTMPGTDPVSALLRRESGRR